MKWITVALLAFAFLQLAAGASAQSILVQRPVPYSEDGDVAEKIRNECKIDEQLADFLKASAGENGVEIQFSDGPVDRSKGRVLDLRITSAISMGNAFIGHQKSTAIVGTLYENGRKIASFKARRNSMGGAFAGYKGSCAVLGRTVKVLGEDVAKWLKAPVDGAKLGDA
ncbi:MAG: hypothetical protein U0900_19895 [Myxococcota bacterium]